MPSLQPEYKELPCSETIYINNHYRQKTITTSNSHYFPGFGYSCWLQVLLILVLSGLVVFPLWGFGGFHVTYDEPSYDGAGEVVTQCDVTNNFGYKDNAGVGVKLISDDNCIEHVSYHDETSTLHLGCMPTCDEQFEAGLLFE